MVRIIFYILLLSFTPLSVSDGLCRSAMIAELITTLKGGLDQPSDIAIHKNGQAYVLDGLNGRVVVFGKSGKLLFSFGRLGAGEGELNLPMAIHMEADTLYVADTGNSRIAVFDRSGNFIRNIDLEGEKGKVEPVGIIVNDGNIIWSDRKNHMVCSIKDGKNDCRGGWGEGDGLFRYPFMLAADAEGYIHVVDVLNGEIQVFNSRGVYSGSLSGFGLLPEELFRPNGIAFDAEGRLFVTDSYLGKVSIFDSEGYGGRLSDKKREIITFETPVGIASWRDRLYVVDMGRDSVDVFRLTKSAFPREEGSVRAASMEKCVTCHLTWSPEYEESLRDSSSPVLPVVSPRLCYSCHHGAVIDSRRAMGKGRQHPEIHHKKEKKKVSGTGRSQKAEKRDKIPPDFPLTANDELYCGSCHTPHAQHKDATGLDAKEGNPWLRVDNKNKDICFKCHKTKLYTVLDRKAAERGKNHPVGIALQKAPEGAEEKEYASSEGLHKGLPEKLESKGAILDDGKRMVCRSCHGVHGTEGKKLLLMENADDLCVACHAQMASGDRKEAREKGIHPVNVKMENPVKIGGEEVKKVGCLTCHSVHEGREKSKLLTRKMDADQFCEACHSRHNAKGAKDAAKKGIHPVNLKLEKPLKIGEKETKEITCLTCHSLHKGKKNSAALIIDNREGELCDSCHKGKKAVAGTDHDLRVTAKESANSLRESPDKAGLCGSCHTMHRGRSYKPSLFAQTWEFYSGIKSIGSRDRLCFDCHRKAGAAEKKIVKEYSHPHEDVVLRSVTSVMPLFNGKGLKSERGRIKCVTCHDPHRWSPETEKVIASTDKPENREGNVLNSFLRRKGAKGAFCVDCHGLEARVKYKYYHDKKAQDKAVDYIK